MQQRLNRREAIALGLALPIVGSAAAATRDERALPALIEDVRHYSALGPHRTGSAGNNAALAWIESRLARAGFTVDRQPVAYPDHDVRAAFIGIGQTIIPGIAQHPAGPTGADGLHRPLVLADDQAGTVDVKGRIAVIRLPYARHSSILEARTARPLRAAIDAGAAGLILVTRGPTAEALALNAPLDHPIAGVPSLVVAPRDADPLIAAAARGDGARLVVDAAPSVASSANLVAHRPGQGRSIVVSTPLSGWFACAGERGSGVAVFLRLAAVLATHYPTADLRFAGFVGHEREYVGGDLFVTDRAPPPDDVRLWVHIGAGFAARDWHEVSDRQLMPLPSVDPQRYLLSPEAWIDALRPIVRGLPGFESPYPATVENSAGEARHILERGYAPMVTTIGAHRFHHARQDDAEKVDAVGLEKSWQGWSAFILTAIDRYAYA